MQTAIAYLGRGRIVNPPKYTAREWSVPDGADARPRGFTATVSLAKQVHT